MSGITFPKAMVANAVAAAQGFPPPQGFPKAAAFPPPIANPASPTIPTFAPPQANTFSFESTDPSPGKFIIIIGPPATGKTTACLTFPNPRFLNLDNKLPVGAQCVPFHKPEFCDRLAPRPNKLVPPNRKDAILNWLYTNVGQLPPDITLILDSFSALSDAFHVQAELVENIGMSKAGNRALLKVFGAKLGYLDSVFTLLKYAPCRVIVTVHTMPEYNETGEPTGAVKAFCTGSFSDKILSYATDIVRSYIDVDANTGKPRVDPVTGECIGYRWKLTADRVCQYTHTLLTLPKDVQSIRARYQDFAALAEQFSAPAPATSPAPAETSNQTTGAS